MPKLTLSDLANLQNEVTAVSAINSNNALIEAALENTLSRDGTTPNPMIASIDMNSNRILNLPAPLNATEPLRFSDLVSFMGGGTITNIPAGGDTGAPLVKVTAADYDVGWGNSIRLTGVGTFTSGAGLQLGYDGTNGYIQSYSNGTITPQPLIYAASSHSWKVGVTEVANLSDNINGFMTKHLTVMNTLNNTTKSFSITDCSLNPNTPLFMQWGASAGSSIAPITAEKDNYWRTGMIISYVDRSAATVETDTTGLWLEQHVSQGAASVSGISVQAHMDATATGGNHSIVAQYLGAHAHVGLSGGAGGVWGQTIGVLNYGNTVSQMVGTEYDINTTGNTVQKYGIVLGEQGTGTVTGTWTPAAGPILTPITASSCLDIQSFGGSPWAHGINIMQRSGGSKPVSENLVYAGGFDLVNGWGLNFSNVAWSGTGGPMLIPNNTYIKALNATATPLRLIGVTSGNLISIGTGATIDPTSGGGAFGGSTLTNAVMNGTAGGGYLQLNTQSTAPSASASGPRLYATAANSMAWMGVNSFVRTIDDSAITANRTYTLPNTSGTFSFIDVAETITGAKTFGAAGNVGKLIIAGTTSGTTVLNASATASGTLTLPAATDTLIGKATTDTLTNKTYNTAGTGNVFSINSQQITGFSGLGNTVALNNSPGFTTPNIGVATATSINFGGDALANYTSSGTWTPIDSSGAGLTFTSVNARYTRIGNMVFAYGRLTYPSTANGANVTIGGLPFTIANATYASCPGTLYCTTGSTNAHSISANINTTTFAMTKSTGAASINSDVSTAVLLFQLNYPVA